MPIANEMVNFLLKPIKYPHLHDKYASKKHLKVSVAIRQWALYFWDEGAGANLSTLNAVDDIRKLVAKFYNREEGSGIVEQQA
jgi:molybdate-binding protein